MTTDRSEKRYRKAADVKHLVLSGADDSAVADAFDCLLTSCNMETAATNYLAVAGYVCHFRPHMAARLLPLPIDCLVQLGLERHEQVFLFVRYEIERAPSHFTEDAGPEGLAWLDEELPRLDELVGQLLADGMRRYPAD